LKLNKHACARPISSLRLTCVFRLRRPTSCQQRQEVGKKRRPGVCALSSQKKKRDERVPCASRPRRGFWTGRPWPVQKRFGIHASPGANTRAGPCRRGLRCSAQTTGRKVKSPSKATATSKTKTTSKAGPWRACTDVPSPPEPIKLRTYRSSTPSCSPSLNLGTHGTHGTHGEIRPQRVAWGELANPNRQDLLTPCCQQQATTLHSGQSGLAARSGGCGVKRSMHERHLHRPIPGQA